MLIYQEFIAINEELPAFDPTDKLRWAVHEIVTRLKTTTTDLSFAELSEKLKKYKINISTEDIKAILVAWDDYSPDYSIFKKEDKDWLDVWPYRNCVQKKAKKTKQSFGKHRKKDPVTYTTYNWTGRSVNTYGKNYNPDNNNPYGNYYWD